MSATTVLLLDDEDALRELYRTTLEAEGFVVRQATCLAQALAVSRCTRAPLDLLVADVSASGIPAARALLVDHPGLQVILCSVRPEGHARLLGLDAIRFVEKPVAPGLLVRTAREILDERSRARSTPTAGRTLAPVASGGS